MQCLFFCTRINENFAITSVVFYWPKIEIFFFFSISISSCMCKNNSEMKFIWIGKKKKKRTQVQSDAIDAAFE